MKILLVEDDPINARLTRVALESDQHVVDHAEDGRTGLELASINSYDVLVLDILLPGIGGIDIVRELRGEGVDTPVLMLTALDADGDIVRGLDAGADDYLTKPYTPNILLARIRSLGRRSTPQRATTMRVGELEFDTVTKQVMRGGETVELTAKELMLLELFMRNPGRLLTRETIGEHLWELSFDPQSNVVDSLIRRLRGKIDRDSHPSLIQTVRGIGYRLGGPGGEG